MPSEPVAIDLIARLAKLSFDPNTLKEIAQDLEAIFQLIQTLSAIDTSSVLPLEHPIDEHNPFLREDTVTEWDERTTLQHLAPLTEQGFYLVPTVIEH